jgi:molybdenum cofactor cytidylyltransferase
VADRPPSRTAAVILAAGLGRRFGGGKLLAELDGRPLIQHVLELATAAGLAPVVVVLGASAADLEVRVAWHGELRVVNPAPERGISVSLQAGFTALAERADADRAVILLADQPRLSQAQLQSILAAAPDPHRPIVVPRYAGAAGNPVLLERSAWPLVHELRGDTGMSQLFGTRSELVRYVDIDGGNPDVDTPEQLAALDSRP